ncbi:LolA family protein [Geomobilimonas luticola]|uniref:Outer membrane lipoprotein carrier protein LolA n=1 Tax=Geomobilimonas luticola TaxID=1114878 RepID=A0ABS5S804_9BACT|nr:outer membrane lipoprotein carrier protein LolA [Geomobilimonas luticola]MBT0651505.1 outer membrane lipoprotein carrier protein LolA [Geomobilimonas luticola]
MKRFCMVAAALLLALGTGFAEAATLPRVNVGLNDVIDTLEKSYRSLNDVTADFFQRSTLASSRREMRAEGQMFLKPPTSSSPLMFRFDYFRPLTQEIVCDGRTMWMYLPENRQVIQSDVSFFFGPFSAGQYSNQPVNFLQGMGRFSKDFLTVFSSQQQDMAGNYVLELTPRRSSVTIAKMYLVIHREAVLAYVQNNRDITRIINDPRRPEFAFPLLSSTVIDPKGNTTIMEFSNVRANSRLMDGMFTFTVPAGVEVVRPPTGR